MTMTDQPTVEEERIWVVAHPRAGNRVALADRDPRHPLNEFGEPEVFVSKDTGPVEVYPNAAVNARLDRLTGDLMVVDGRLLEQAKQVHQERQERQKANRERMLLLERQEQTDKIRDQERKANELHMKVLDLESRLNRALEVETVKLQADDAEEAHRAKMEQAKALASQDDDDATEIPAEDKRDQTELSGEQSTRMGPQPPEGGEPAHRVQPALDAKPVDPPARPRR